MSTGDILALIGVVLGLGGSFLAFRELYLIPHRERQELLDALPNPALPGLPTADFVKANSLDLAGLEARLAMPRKRLYRALEKLVIAGRIELFIEQGVNVGNHPQIPIGAVLTVPYVYKGLLPPSLRSTRGQVLGLLQMLRKHP